MVVETRGGSFRRSVAIASACLAVLLIGVGEGSAQADVTAVRGSAYGHSCDVAAFGMSCTPPRPTPTATLASDASDSPQTASAATSRVEAGPATVFSSGRIDVSTQGTLGPAGSVTSSASITTVNASGDENLTAGKLASACTASEAAVGGSTTITGGELQTDNGDTDPTNTIPNHPPVTVTLPESPAPNTTFEGHLHIGNTTDNFRWVFNEQTPTADGSVTVSAAHEYLLGPVATGNLILGRSACGTTAAPINPDPDGGPGPDPTLPPAPFAGCAAETANVIRGTAESESIKGTQGADRIFAGRGNDAVDGLPGDDCVDLGLGADRGLGGSGADLIVGGLGKDSLLGDAGDDRLRGGASGDRVFGGLGDDRLDGEAGSDLITGGLGRDPINGGAGKDVISGGSGDDRLSGGTGDDRIIGQAGNDSMKGNSGHDSLSGNSGNDRIDARDGQSDRIRCGAGRDTVIADRIDRPASDCERVSRR